MRTRRSLLSRRKLIQNGMFLATGTVTPPALCRAVAQTTGNGDASGQTWILENDRIQRVIRFDPRVGLYTAGLTDLATHGIFAKENDAVESRTSEFSFQCNGRPYRGVHSGFQLVHAEATAAEHGRLLRITLRSHEQDLEVTVHYRIYDGQPAIRKHLVVRNVGTTALRITHLNIESLGIAMGPENEIVLNAQYGTLPREIFYTGRSEDAGLMVANSRTGLGLAILTEVPGYMKRTEISGWSDADHLSFGVMYDTDLMPFERNLSAGQAFTTAAVSVVTYKNGDGFQDPRWVLPTYTAKTLVRQVDKAGPPWIYNTWEPFERDINQAIAMQLIEIAGTMGFDIFTIDDGWQLEYGENGVDLKSFPDGLAPVTKAIEARGMRLGLWIPLAAIGKDTTDYRAHSEWASLNQEQQQKITETKAGSKVVMCLATDFRDAAADRVIDCIERFHLAYVKLDLTTIFNTYGEAPGCWAKGHFHSSWAESLNMIYEGIAYVTSKIYSKHPDVLLDLTFELWGQKHIIDAGLLAAGDLDWLSNVDDRQPDSAGPIQARQLLYQRASSMPVESMLIGNLHAEIPSIQETFATAIGSAPVLLGDLRRLSAGDRTYYHEKVQWFKSLRKRTRISESFFPLGSWRQPSSNTWDGFARLARTGEGIVVLFRNKSDVPSALVQLPLMPGGSYRVKAITEGNDVGIFQQSDWTRGVVIPFPSSSRAVVLEITKADASTNA